MQTRTVITPTTTRGPWSSAQSWGGQDEAHGKGRIAETMRPMV